MIEVNYSPAHNSEQVITKQVASLDRLERVLDDLADAGSRLRSVVVMPQKAV